jgi:hypothetical protein
MTNQENNENEEINANIQNIKEGIENDKEVAENIQEGTGSIEGNDIIQNAVHDIKINNQAIEIKEGIENIKNNYDSEEIEEAKEVAEMFLEENENGTKPATLNENINENNFTNENPENLQTSNDFQEFDENNVKIYLNLD